MLAMKRYPDTENPTAVKRLDPTATLFVMRQLQPRNTTEGSVAETSPQPSEPVGPKVFLRWPNSGSRTQSRQRED